ncbi:MAG: DNA polymerase/3'-5' exonuclease PolX [Myxococcota bacterium]
MENAEVVEVLTEMADVLEVTGGNRFKVRAYRQAAQVLDTLALPVSELWRLGKLTELPGIGERIAEHIGRLLETGTFPEHDRLMAKVPAGVRELLAIEGVGPKTVQAVWKQLGVADVDAFEVACRDGRLEALPRMGPTRVAAILEAIGRYRARRGRVQLHRALPYAESILSKLRMVPGVHRAEAAGSVRRRKETVGDIDLLVAADAAEPVMRAFAQLAEVAQVLAVGPTKSSARLRTGLQVDVRVLPVQSFGAALHYFTGSKAHNIELRTRAVRKGLKVSEYGVFDREGRRLSGEDEADVFSAVGLPWIPPELREGAGELEAAEEGRLPKLIEEGDVQGDLHVHTKASADSRATLEEVVQEARRLGRKYVAITDHSKSRPLGLDAEGVRRHAQEVRAFNARLRGGARLLTGVEVDILPDGSLDLPDDALAAVDVVVASVHTRFRAPRKEMTERVVRALRSGQVDILGHPSGRQLGARDASDVDFDQVLAAAREEGVALEVNAMPERLDLSDKECRRAKDAGVKVAINSDAHVAEQLENLRYGVWVARRGWLEKGDVINTRPFR